MMDDKERQKYEHLSDNEREQKLSTVMHLMSSIQKSSGDKFKGKIQPKQEEQKTRTVYTPTNKTFSIAVPIESLKTHFDLVINDIEIDDRTLSEYFESRLTGKSPANYNNQFGMMHFLRQDYEKAESFFVANRTPESVFNYGILKMMRKDADMFTYTKEFAEAFPKNPYAYLLLTAYLTQQGMFDGAYKSLVMANKILNYTFLDMVIAAYEKDFSKANSYLSKCFLENRAKYVVNFINYMCSVYSNDYEKKMTLHKRFEKDTTPCGLCVNTIQTKKIGETPDFCLYHKKLFALIEKDSKFQMPDFEKREIDFVRLYNAGMQDACNKIYAKMTESFGELKLMLVESSFPQKGLRTFEMSTEKEFYKITLKGPDYYSEIKNLFESLKRNYKKDFDFIIDVPYYEALRLIFGWRMCSILY